MAGKAKVLKTLSANNLFLSSQKVTCYPSDLKKNKIKILIKANITHLF